MLSVRHHLPQPGQPVRLG